MPADPLLAFVPRHVAADVARRGSRVAGRGRRLDAVTLFADIAGFTPMSEALGRVGRGGTEELTDVLNDYFEVMIGVVEAHGGTVCAFGGDAVTVLFPIRGARSHAPARAVACALAMQERMPAWAAVETAAGTFALTMKAGLAAGPVLCATVGDPALRLEHVVAGAAVDACAEAEHHAAPGEVLVHPSLADRCHGLVGRRRGGHVVATGLERPPPRWRPSPRPRPADLATVAAFLHPLLAERVRTGNEALLDEHRRVSVLFAGFDGFDYDGDRTALARLQEWVARVLGQLDELGGHLRQVDMGDKGNKLLVLFGAPVVHEDDEERALRFALELRRDAPVPLRIGVARGVTFCGSLGSPMRREYAAVGDTVNLAARLMGAAAPGEIVVARETGRPLPERFAFRRRRAVTLKGKARPQPIAVLSAERRPPATPAPSVGRPLVGRSGELGTVRSALERVASGAGGVMLAVTGAPGIGKSRLVAAAVDAAVHAGLTPLAGACQSTGARTAYLPWQPVMRALLGLTRDDPASVARAVASLAPGLEGRSPLLGPVLRVPIEDTPLTAPLDPELRAELLRSLVLDLVARRAADEPLLVVLEDCHWIDALSLQLLADVRRALDRLRVTVLVTLRPDAPTSVLAALAETEPVVRIGLEPLTPSSSVELGRAVLRDAYQRHVEVGPALARLLDRAGGNPFHLEEVVRSLRDRGVDPDDDDAIGALELPAAVQDLVAARIDRLDERDRTALKVASVLGRRFEAPWLWGTYPAIGAARTVRASLGRLDAAELTAPEPGPGEAHAFRHVTTRDVAYDGLSYAVRRDLHERAGQHLERRYAPTLDAWVDTIAHHFGESGNIERQRHWFLRAGDHAAAAFSNDAALEWYGRLLPLVAGGLRGDVLVRRGRVLEHVGDWDAARSSYDDALALAAAGAGGEGPARAAIGNLEARREAFAEARWQLEQALRDLDETGDADAARGALSGLSFVTWQQSEHEASLGYAEEHHRRSVAAGDPAGESQALDHIGLVHWHRGDTAEARDCFERALAAAERAGNARAVIHVLNDLAGLEWEQGDLASAFGRVRDALAVAESIGYRHAAAVLLGNAAEICRVAGELDRALALTAEALDTFLGLGDGVGVLNQAGNAAATLSAAGAVDAADALYRAAVELGRLLDNPYFLCEYLVGLARHRLAACDVASARAPAHEGLAIARDVHRRDVVDAATALVGALDGAPARPAPDEPRSPGGPLPPLDGVTTRRVDVAALVDAVEAYLAVTRGRVSTLQV